MAVSKLFDLSGRTALITGSSRGIGKAIALGFAEYGADVAIHCRSTQAQARQVAGGAAACGVNSCVVLADLAEAGAPQALFDQTSVQLGRVDILVLDASV